MPITAAFKEAVRKGEKKKVRIMLTDAMVLDKTMGEFDKMLAYADSHMKDLYDEHDGEQLETDVDAWTDAYKSQLLYCVVDNFSKERVGLLREMLLSKRKSNIKSGMAYKKDYEPKESEGFTNKQMAGAGIAVVGIGMAVKGFCAAESAKLLIIGGVILALAGVYVLKFKEEN